MTKNKLYFERAGMDFYNEEQKENSDIGNHRIRTAFKNNEGKTFFVDLGNTYKRDKKGKQNGEMGISFDFIIDIEKLKEQEEKTGLGHKFSIDFDREELKQLNYNKQDLIQWINKNLNCNFDDIEVLNNFYDYRVFGDNGTYNLMENIDLNHERAVKREEAYNKIDNEYRTKLNEKYSVIGVQSMDSDSITIRCHASSEKLSKAELERVVTLSTN